METVQIKIKKSKNVFAWGNQNVGKTVTATIENDRYEVDFLANPQIECTRNWLSGFVEFKDADLVK
jgi:hypothetical protein